MMTEYSELIAGAHVGREKFVAWVETLTEPLRKARERLASLSNDFDVDKAIGKQLDAIGDRVGVSRRLPIKLTGVYFALDNKDGPGLDFGVWKGPFDPSDGMTELGDETFRAVLKAKILANHWNGTNESLPQFLSETLSYFGVDAKVIDLQDLQTMHVALQLTKSTTPPIVWELFSRRIIDVTAAGVGFSIIDNNAWFGFDYDTESVKGLDQAHWFPFDEVIDGNRKI